MSDDTKSDVKTILSLEDIQKMTPDLVMVWWISREDAQIAETCFFSRNENVLHLVTTNDFPEKYRTIKSYYEDDGYEIHDHYTDHEAFTEVLTWYDQRDVMVANQKREKQDRLHAIWTDALDLIRYTYEHHGTFTEEKFIFELLRLSYQAWASDVHFQSEEAGIIMRLRVDGILETVVTFSHVERKKYLMKIKFISGAKMNLDRVAQDGRFDFDLEGTEEKLDVRVSILPWLRGESVVLRFLDSSKWLMNFEKVGFGKYHMDMLLDQLGKNYGMILVTGPTWSWKTTTVYSMINYLNTSDRKIITLEDPVEYELPGIEQSQINEDKWYTFEWWLKWVLRHDPDVIVVWEIRTLETAEMAINAALTGHLVISTLHTNSAIESLARLVNMWVKPYMLASALNAVIWQRLVRRLATTETYPLKSWDDVYMKKMISEIHKHHKKFNLLYDGTLQRPIWWERAKSTWYKWRVAVVEMLEVNEVVTQAIMNGKNSYEIYEIAFDQGFLTLEHNALMKVLEWMTSLAEVRRRIWK